MTSSTPRPVSVIVPVYNAPEFTRRLVDSLAQSNPSDLGWLKFYFWDDGSPDPRMQAVFEHPFFSRSDVKLTRRNENRGFIFTVNEAIAASPSDSDVVILNSDTEVGSNVFSSLQLDAYAEQKIASVTPLTNNGTIASLFRFPWGASLPEFLSIAQLAGQVHHLQIPTPQVPAPTGVGFCMYMRRDALKELGDLDPIYGAGYGEETDWCQRAISRGWQHRISSRAFVFHAGTQSFQNKFKKAAIEKNGDLLLERYPHYMTEVTHYVALDPLWLARAEIVYKTLKSNSKTQDVQIEVETDAGSSCCLILKNSTTVFHREKFHSNCLAEVKTLALGAFAESPQLRDQILQLDQAGKKGDLALREQERLERQKSSLYLTGVAGLREALGRYPKLKRLLKAARRRVKQSLISDPNSDKDQ